MQFASGSVMRKATERDASWGLALLGEAPWTGSLHFLTGVRAYLEARSGELDWLGIREELVALAARPRDGASPEQPGRESAEVEQIDRILMRRWARDDLEAAVRWFAVDSEPVTALNPELRTGRTVEVLNALPGDERHRVLDWVDRHRSDPGWSDQVVVEYARSISSSRPGPAEEILASLPADATDRLAVVSAFVAPRRATKGGPDLLRHPPESLLRLIEAAHLDPEAAANLREVVENTPWPAE